jgi:membrane fusion protein, multidrug efflux system
MRKILTLLVFSAVVVVLVLVKIFALSGDREKVAQAVVNQALPVECHIAGDTAVSYRVETVGTLNAREQVDIVSEIPRKVVSILMKEGARVGAGQLLFKLDDADITSRIKKMTLQARLAEVTESREKVLLANGGISLERFDEVTNQRQTLQAEIDVLKVDLEKTEIRAPFSGIVGMRKVSVGALVAPGSVLANLQDISRMTLDFSIPERYAGDMKPGSAVTFRTDYLPEEQQAQVETVEPSVDQRTRTLPARALILNKDGRLVPGTSAKVYLTIMDQAGSIMIPTSALIPSIRGYSVFLARGGKALSVPVKTGTRSSEFVQILEGIAAGDTVVTTNLLRLRNGSPITIQKIY